MIDLHMHTFFSDGVLNPSELSWRAKNAGYSAISITDHGDFSNIDFVIPRMISVCENITKYYKIIALPGIELTYVPPESINEACIVARKLGAKIVVVHGETTSEPVPKGTNKAAILAKVDILAHPGLITKEDINLAVENKVYLEITTRKSHRKTNSHLLVLAKMLEAKLIINNDVHAPEDILIQKDSFDILKEYGMLEKDFLKCQENSEKIVKSKLNSDNTMDVVLA